ncbi:inositol monophosphatase family protein [Limobrevibacterium gyesilva]|uniref:Inositol-1-monophosphatase n=1 Tax=Limobrevibacterium gyesilva TaxID=2991712 RepID=A0AA41YHT3_9PROT|nr:inositol monophosphatase family protein [Limobrevibacterium gyesilva]MCW3473676.1 inositol monophosphatase [Limobrevibacterium gyesilva]
MTAFASTALARRLDTAVQLAEEAGRLALRLRPPPGAPVATLKGAQDWLTEADGAVEEFLSRQLAERFPEDGFQGEETGRARSGTLRWVVDPIDGTSNYARGSARFCVSLGLIEDRTPLLGVLVAPAMGETFAARRGAGATLNGAPIRAAATTDLSRAMVECGWSPRRPNGAYFRLVEGVMGTGAMLRAGGSGALGLADVAAGRIDAYIELHINLWDVAAALAILQEAGATVSPFLDGNGLAEGNPIMAAAPGIAEGLVVATGFPLA